MNARIALLLALLTASNAGAEYIIDSQVSIFGGRWQVGSDATTIITTSSGGRAGAAYIGHTHTLTTTNRYQATYPKGLGSAMSSLINTPTAGSTLPLGCNEATVLGQSFDSEFPAASKSGSASICFSSILTPYQYRDSAGSTSDDGRESPIIFDLTGHGYRLTSHKGGVQFDIRNDGKPIQIAWTDGDSGNAFLALDRNGNGTIDSGAELFGSRTPLNGGGVGPTGFHALADLDTNHDFLVDNLDAAWSSLLLWTDRNHDGASTQDDLQHLADSAITALEFDFQRVGREDKWGNDFRLMSHARFGSERRSYYDVWLLTR